MAETAPAEQVPPPPPPEPQFPARNRIIVGGAGLGLAVLAVVLLTLPTGEIAPGAVPHSIATRSPRPVLPPAAPPATPTGIQAPPPLPPALPVAPPPSAPPTRPAPGSIVVTGLPRAATVRVDGKRLSRRRAAVAPGRHILELSLTNYAPVRDTVLVDAGQSFIWSPKLVRTATAKIAAVTKRPPPAPASRSKLDEAGCQQQMAARAWAGAYQVCVRAAHSGSASSAGFVGLLFQHGNGVRRSDDSAAAWFTIAARGGNAGAMSQLGDAYERGHGVHKDQAAALDWYTRAANAGDAAGQYALGQAYEKGRLGMPKDRAKALQWYRKAATQGYKDAATRVHRLGS